MFGFLFNKANSSNKEKEQEKILKNWLKSTLGLKTKNINIYLSIFDEKKRLHKERMELIGDSVLSLSMIEFLLRKFPYMPEGELTQIKSRLASRHQLNKIGQKTGILELCTKLKFRIEGPNTSGNLLESLVGAIYIDIGFQKTSEIIQKKLLSEYCDLDKIIKEDDDYKSQLYKLCQKKKWKLEFRSQPLLQDNAKRKFLIKLIINGDVVVEGQGYKKKKIEQNLAYHALKKFRQKEA
ncbi:MAG: putative dsRNA-binding protein [Bacteroidia bacterium]|nr:putative dsRNA-binding protein [Bacteroidia bacterium]